MKKVVNYTFEQLYDIYLNNAVNKDKLLTKEEFYKIVWLPRKEIYG